MQSEKKQHLKEKAEEELKLFVLIFAYLFVFFAAFLAYRRMISRELGASYLKYGYALIEAAVIAKVILIGKALGLGAKRTGRPLMFAVLRSSLVYGALVAAFTVLEHVVDGWIHRKNLAETFSEFATKAGPEALGKSLILFVAFLPFFAFWEVGRLVGGKRMFRMFFRDGSEANAEADR